MKRLMLIVNPFSGRGQARRFLIDIVSTFSHHGYIVSVYTTSMEHTAESLSQQYSNHYDLVVCIGGDGTLSDVICGLMRTESPPPVGYIPMGTANDVASTLALSKNPKESAFTVINGSPRPIDIGIFDKKFFTYIAAFGAFTEASYLANQGVKRLLGHLAYVFEGFRSVSRIKPHHTIIEYDDGTIEGDFVFGGVTNSTSVAGLVKLDPRDVDLADGLFEVILVRKPVKLHDFYKIVDSIRLKTYDKDNILMLHTQKINFKFDHEVAWTRDGENGGMHREVAIENCKNAINIIL